MSRVVRGRRVVTPDGVRPAAIHIENGRITEIRDYNTDHGPNVHDVGDAVIGPSFPPSYPSFQRLIAVTAERRSPPIPSPPRARS